jgi:hypothetical protein
MYWNPAALVTLTEPQSQATYHDVFSLGLARYTSVSFAWRPVTEEATVVRDTIRVHIRRDRGAAIGGSIGLLAVDLEGDSYYELSPALALALPLRGGAAIGFSARYFRTSSSLDGVSANGYAAEVGVHQRFGDRVNLGLTFRNLIAELNWHDGGNESLPRELGAAASVRLLRRVLAAGGERPRSLQPRARGGVIAEPVGTRRGLGGTPSW